MVVERHPRTRQAFGVRGGIKPHEGNKLACFKTSGSLCIVITIPIADRESLTGAYGTPFIVTFIYSSAINKPPDDTSGLFPEVLNTYCFVRETSTHKVNITSLFANNILLRNDFAD